MKVVPISHFRQSPDRAKPFGRPFVKNYPGYCGGLLVEFKWIFEKMDVGFGMTINPEWNGIGLDLDNIRDWSTYTTLTFPRSLSDLGDRSEGK